LGASLQQVTIQTNEQLQSLESQQTAANKRERQSLNGQ
jgi:hypothetical protein